ncbi:MAG: chorismate mutase [Ferrimicrobium sp.]
MTIRAIRGATTVQSDDANLIGERTRELVSAILTCNSLVHDQLISIIFTATDDLHSLFPATAARELGLGDVPLMCAQELTIDGAVPRCIRVLIHVESDTPRGEIAHVYQYGAVGLRDDLPG